MSNIERVANILERVNVIGFDLDDTLWDNRIVIKSAIKKQFDYLQEKVPSESLNHLKATYTYFVERRVTDDAKRYQDMSLLRQDALSDLCDFFKVDRKIATEAFSIFYTARQSFQLFDDVEPLLKKLSQKNHLFAFSNGNASLDHTRIKPYFDFHWRGGLDGPAKPSGDLIKKAAERYKLPCDQILYVGDHFHIDGQASINAGCYGLVIPQEPIDKDVFEEAKQFQKIVFLNNLKEFSTAISEYMNYN